MKTCKECGQEIKDTDFGTKCIGCGYVPSERELHLLWLESMDQEDREYYEVFGDS